MATEDSFDIFGSDPFGRDYLYGLSTGQERLGLQPPPQGLQLDPRPYDQMQATPRGFTSGLFSDVLGRTLNMPSMPRTGIPSLDLLYANRNPLFNLMGVGDVQKTAERISYGQPLTTGSGMTLKPREEAIFAGMAVAPFVGEAVNLGARAGRAGARMVGERIAENVTMGRPNLPSMLAEPRSSLFAVEPSPSMAAADESSAMRQQLTGKMQALLAQKKVATSVVEVSAINQQIGELQAQFKSLPAVGRVAREVVAPQITAPVSDLGFYSAAEQAAMNLERSKGTGQSFLNDLMNAPDVKKDELSWIGLDDFLKDKPNVTKQEVQDFIASNKIDLQEVRLGEPFTEDPVGVSKRLAIFDKYEPDIQALYKEMDNPRYRLVNRGMSAEEYNRGVVLQNRGFRGEPLTAQEQSELDGILSRLDGNTVKEFANAEEARKVYLAMSPEEKLQHSIRPVKSSTELQQEINTLQRTRDIEADKAYVIPEPAPSKHQRWQLAGGENYREILLKMPENMSEYNKYTESLRAKYGQGGFANLPLTDIERARLEKFYANEDVSPYKHSHWGDEPNVLAHIRVNDRVDADGKKMLLVEEIQSDWHQAGRESGYQRKDLTPDQIELKYIPPNIPEGQNPANYPGYYEAFDKNTGEFIGRHSGSLNQEQAMRDAVSSANQFKTGVPDAPFKDTWYQLSLKRILKYAADNGYERVGLTTGKQQIDRFSNELRQNVDQIDFSSGYPNQNTTTITATKNGQPTFEGNVVDGKFIDGAAKGKTIDEVLGKSIAQKIQSHDPSQGMGTIKGDDLTIGGEGMKKYYDEIYPKFLEKYGKKWDASVGETKLNVTRDPSLKDMTSRPVGVVRSDYGWSLKLKDGSSYGAFSTEESALKKLPEFQKRFEGNGDPIRYIDITPKMKECVKKGQPLAAAEQTPEMLASGGLDYADPFRNPLLESSIG